MRYAVCFAGSVSQAVHLHVCHIAGSASLLTSADSEEHAAKAKLQGCVDEGSKSSSEVDHRAALPTEPGEICDLSCVTSVV